MSTITVHRAALAALLLAAAPLAAQQPPAPDTCDARLAPALDTIRALMAEQQLPSVAFAVAQRGRVLCETAFGYADIERRVPATAHTIYSLASISKPVTATAVMQLVERGMLELDAPANHYLATPLRAFEGDADSATIRRLLTHTAGLPLHYQFFYAGGPRAPPMDTSIARWGVLVYPPGERYLYANFGYGVLDHIVARVSGRSFARYLEAEVFAPLGLHNTLVSDGAGLGTRAATRYHDDFAAIPPYTFDHLGGSAVWSSAHDLVRFGMFHLHDGRSVLSGASIAFMQQSHAPTGAPGQTRGLGWSITDSDRGHRRVSHTGSMPGVATVLNIFPEEELVIVALTNLSRSPAVARIANAAAAALLPPRAEPARAQPASAGGTNVVPGNAARDGALTASLHGVWQGSAITHAGEVPIELRVGSGGAHIRVGNARWTPLDDARAGEDWISGRVRARIVEPDAAPADDSNEHTVLLTLLERDGRLAGWASSIAAQPMLYGAVSVRVELRRDGGEGG